MVKFSFSGVGRLRDRDLGRWGFREISAKFPTTPHTPHPTPHEKLIQQTLFNKYVRSPYLSRATAATIKYG
ncbi:MAG: hypothetical protein PX636_19635 [Microcystis sp. M53598_WE2]|uniref:hypothetical protein n=1 Tax=Microcystis sp. M53598_WE2 TaxID=3030677 RepID=UPI00258D4E15|nr:hypothetical protein [Microcystis sp. M53598_WE2]MDJ0673140.1 hypothetical protein [Microcystis sp. M53598_WE2]